MRQVFIGLLALAVLASCGQPPMKEETPYTEETYEAVIVPEAVEAPEELAAPEAATDMRAKVKRKAATEPSPSVAGFEFGPQANAFSGENIVAEDPMAQALSEMKTYPIAYETPTNAKMDEAFEVTLAIDATGDTTAADALPGRDVVVESTARLSNPVEATLSGAAFEIELMNKGRQRLSPFKESTWRWAVTPKQAGQHTLYLEIHAVLGEDESVLLDSFADEISVVVTQHKSGIFGIPAEEIRTWIGIVGGSFSAILGLVALISLIRSRKVKSKGGDGAGDDPDMPDL